MRFRFVHAADLHLDTPFEGVGRSSPDIAAQLQEASLAAFDALVDLTLREDAAFLVLAGDLYDGASRGLRAQLRFLAGLERLSSAGVGVMAVHGNHDPLDEGWSAVRRWPEGVTFFGADEPGSVCVDRDGVRLATVYGMSFRTREETRNLARMFRRTGSGGLHVAVLHSNVGGLAEHAPYAPCSPQDLVDAGMDYWALGHVHRRRTILEGGPWAMYPGCLQARSPHPGELGPKGALVVEGDSEQGIVAPPRFVALDKVRFAGLSLDVSASSDLAGAAGMAREALTRVQGSQDGRGLVLRLGFRGETVWAADLIRVCESGELLDQLREEMTACDPFIWIDSLDCRARVPLDREGIRSRGDFAAEVVAQSERLAASPAALSALDEELRRELITPARAGLLSEVAVPDPAAALPEAERLCLRLLTGGEGR